MKINTMRKIDYYAGGIICRFLLLLRNLYNMIYVFSKPKKNDFKNILIIKFFGMGSILLASPALRLIKSKYPCAKVTILTLSENRKLCEMLPSIDEVICLSVNNFFNFVVSFIKTIHNIRKRDIDVIVDLEFLTNFSALVSLLVSLFSKGKTVVGFNSPLLWRNKVSDINISFSHNVHVTGIFLKVIHSFGVEEKNLSCEPEKAALLKHADMKYMEEVINKNHSIKQCNFFVAVNINAGELSFHRRWPKEYFAHVVEKLTERPDTAVFLIGGKGDVEYVSEFIKTLPYSCRIVNLCGKTTIEEIIGVLNSCNLLITSDSGPLHFAEVIGLDTISFFGPETPYLYGPVYGNHHVFYEDVYCSPCLNIYNSKVTNCNNNICLKNIKPEKVLKVIEDNYIRRGEIKSLRVIFPGACRPSPTIQY